METPECYRGGLGDIAYALLAIKQKAENIESCINTEAEFVGCNYTNPFHDRRRAAEYGSQK
jgi:hypothetical protein